MRRPRLVRRPRPVTVKNRSRVLRPVAKKSHRGLRVGALLLLLSVAGVATLCPATNRIGLRYAPKYDMLIPGYPQNRV